MSNISEEILLPASLGVHLLSKAAKFFSGKETGIATAKIRTGTE